MLFWIPRAYQYFRHLIELRRRPHELPSFSIQPPDRWFHSIDLRNGYMTRGVKPNFLMNGMADIAFRFGVRDKSVLDIGAWDGFYSFEAKRRGASRVLATDHYSWSGAGWGDKRGFDYARECLGYAIESFDVDIPDLDPSKLGTFDLVLFLGVFYHCIDPYAALRKAADMTHQMLVVETVTAANWLPLPLMRFYRSRELNNDPTTYWAPNIRCLVNILRDLGFQRIQVIANNFRHPGTARHFVFASHRGKPSR